SPPYSSPLPPPAPTPLPTLSLHDALPISHHPEPIVDHGVLPLHPIQPNRFQPDVGGVRAPAHRHEDLVGLDLPSVLERRRDGSRSEEHTSELQSRFDLVCRLLLEKKNPPFPFARRELARPPPPPIGYQIRRPPGCYARPPTARPPLVPLSAPAWTRCPPSRRPPIT